MLPSPRGASVSDIHDRIYFLTHKERSTLPWIEGGGNIFGEGVIFSGGGGRKKVGYIRPVGIEARGSAGAPIVVPTRLNIYSSYLGLGAMSILRKVIISRPRS